MILEHTGRDHGPVQNAANYLIEHAPEWAELAQDPQNVMAGGAAVAAAVVASYVGLKVGSKGLRAARKALDTRPGVVTVGLRDEGFLATVTERFIDLPWWIRCMGNQIVGPTRQGKTSLMEPWALQDFRIGHTVVIIETGGDFGKKMLKHADDEGFPVHYLNPLDPTTMKWNVLAGDPELVAERAAATLESVSVSNSVYYEAMNSTIMKNMVHAVHAWARAHGTVPNIAKIKRWLTSDAEIREDLEVEELAEGQVTVELKELKPDVSEWFAHQFFAWPKDDRNKNVSSLHLLLDRWIGGERMREALTPRPGDDLIDIGEALQKPGLLLVHAPAETLGPGPAQTTALWALQEVMFSTVNRPANTPVSVYLDEVHTLLGKENSTAAAKFVDWITGVGKYYVAVHVAYQSFGLLPDTLNRVLESNATNKFILGRLGPSDAEIAQKILGSEKKKVKEVKTTGPDGRAQTTVVEREIEAPRWSIWEIRELERGKCFYLGVRIKGRSMRLAKPVVMRALSLAPLVKRKRQK